MYPTNMRRQSARVRAPFFISSLLSVENLRVVRATRFLSEDFWAIRFRGGLVNCVATNVGLHARLFVRLLAVT